MTNIIFFLIASLNIIFSDIKTAEPKAQKNASIIRHSTYSLEYSEEHEQAKWVCYRLVPSSMNKSITRNDKFIPDPSVTSESADKEDYEKSGYDRGHLKPANDSKTSIIDMEESFYYSNMSPQLPEFNRGIWKELEGEVNDFAEKNGSVWVVTGPILSSGLSKIGPNGVSIPKYYYKIVLDDVLPEINSFAFLLPNAKSNQPLADYLVSIDSIEKITKIDFFYNLDDKIENKIERNIDFGKKLFKNNSSTLSNSGSYFSGNTKSKIFHKESCSGYNCKNCTIKFSSKDQAIKNGYKPCSKCKP